MLSKTLENDMRIFINKYNGGANSTKRIGRITEDDVRYFLYITVLILNAALTAKHMDLMELNMSKILQGDCEPGFLNLLALSPMSPVSLPTSCKNYLVLKSAMSLVLSSKTIDIIYPLIIFFAGLIAVGSYVKINTEVINTIVSTIFNRVKTDGEKETIKQQNMEGEVIDILNKMATYENDLIKRKETDAVESLLSFNMDVNNEKTRGGKSKKNKKRGGKSKKNKTKGGKSKKNKTKKN